jgi:hypothetical protein
MTKKGSWFGILQFRGRASLPTEFFFIRPKVVPRMRLRPAKVASYDDSGVPVVPFRQSNAAHSSLAEI